MSSPRLPIPGGDSENWGDILNDFLRQSHTENGQLKPSTVSAVQLRSGAVTSPAIADGTVSSVKLADDAVTEGKLAQGVRDKLNALASVTDGREVELGTSATHIQWRYVGSGDGGWTNLVELDSLKGEPGDPATNLVTSVNGRQGVVTGLTEQSDLVAHTSATDNPHGVTKAQVGLGNVDNTADIDKPVSTAVLSALGGKQDVGDYIEDDDARLTNARTPTAHAASHAVGGSDELTIAQSQVAGLGDTLSGMVRHDLAQSLTLPQQTQVRTNIGAAAAAYLLVGPGRPDVPATTEGQITGSEPIGCEYRSTDGACVGA